MIALKNIREVCMGRSISTESRNISAATPAAHADKMKMLCPIRSR